MLDVEVALQIILRADAGVTALVSTRITAGVLGQSTVFPAIAFRLSARDFSGVISGSDTESGTVLALATSRYQFFSTARGPAAGSTYGEAKRIDRALRNCLAGFSGTVANSSSPPDTLDIQYILPAMTREFYDDTTQTWQVQSDFQVWAPVILPAP